MKHFLFVLVAGSIPPLSLSAQNEPAAAGEKADAMPGELTADQIVDTVKKGLPFLQPLQGNLKKNGKEVPFVLEMS